MLTAAIPSHLRPHIDVISATKAVTPEFVSSATIDAATSEQEINKIKNKQKTLGLGCSLSLIVISDRRRPLSFYFIK